MCYVYNIHTFGEIVREKKKKIRKVRRNIDLIYQKIAYICNFYLSQPVNGSSGVNSLLTYYQ